MLPLPLTQKDMAHIILSPVKIWHAIVKRIRGYPGANDGAPVSAVWRNQAALKAINRVCAMVGGI